MTSPKEDPEKKEWKATFVKAAGTAAGLWVIGACSILFLAKCTSLTLDDFASLGDGLGAINTLFSGLAFATLVVTMWMQREELKLQRKEMEATRAELSGQREQMAEQNKISSKSALLSSLPLSIANLNQQFSKIRHDYSRRAPFVSPEQIIDCVSAVTAHLNTAVASLEHLNKTRSTELQRSDTEAQIASHQQALAILSKINDQLLEVDRLRTELAR